MNTEIKISRRAAEEICALIEEYLHEGGSGFDNLLLEEALTALGEADRIVVGDR